MTFLWHVCFFFWDGTLRGCPDKGLHGVCLFPRHEMPGLDGNRISVYWSDVFLESVITLFLKVTVIHSIKRGHFGMIVGFFLQIHATYTTHFSALGVHEVWAPTRVSLLASSYWEGSCPFTLDSWRYNPDKAEGVKDVLL